MNDIEKFISYLSRLPGLGPRSARRMALALIKKKDQLLTPLITSLEHIRDTIQSCEICNNLDEVSPCQICQSQSRDRSIICIVEDVSDLWALERTSIFKGQYHVLGGTLSALDGRGPETLKIPYLIQRIRENNIQEVILALNATIEGQTTSHYIMEHIKKTSVKVTQLAQGIPIGGELDYLDDGTLSAAFNARLSLEFS